MRLLAVRQPWASLIVKGLKTIEVRSRPTNIRGKIGIYASNTKYPHVEKTYLFEHFDNLLNKGLISDYLHNFAYSSACGGAIRGHILGTVEITSVKEVIVNDEVHDINDYKLKHIVPNWLLDYRKQYYFWELSNPIKFETPIPIKWPSTGSWASYDLPEDYK